MQPKLKKNPYLFPFLFALGLHLVLLVVIIYQWPDESVRQVGLNSHVQIISAVALSEAKTSAQTPPKAIKTIEKKAEAKPPVVEKKIESLPPVPEKKPESPPPTPEKKSEPLPKVSSKATSRPKVQAQAKAQLDKVEKLKQQKLNAEKAKQLQQKLLQQQLAAEQKKLKLQQQKEMAAAKALQQKLLQQQLANEQKNLKEAAQEQHQALQLQGALDEYKSQIIAAISQYWHVPPETIPNIYCRLLIHLAPTGTVLKIDLLHSSGDPVLDRSARSAVLQASPLPVPKQPGLFDQFRELRLTFRPKGVEQG